MIEAFIGLMVLVVLGAIAVLPIIALLRTREIDRLRVRVQRLEDEIVRLHQQRAAEQQARAQKEFDSYVKSVAGSGGGGGGSAADELARLADLKSKGVISDAEFEQLKAKAIGSSASA